MGSIIKTRSALALAIVFGANILGGCGSEPSTVAPNKTDSFVNYNGDDYLQASKVIAADYLFSIDTSRSMRSYQSSLVNSIESGFVQALANNNVNYRIGFVEGNYQYGGGRPSDFGSNFIGGNYISSYAADPITSILDYLGADLNPNVTELLEASKRLMSSRGSSFTRMGAQLVYVYVTDCTREPSRDDESPDSYTSYANYLKARKPSSIYVSARSIVDKSQCPSLRSAVRAMNSGSDPGGTGSNDSGNYSFNNASSASSLANLSQDITKLTNRFQLRGIPQTGSLFVTKNGVNVPAAGRWTYQSSSNEVVFFTAPAASDHVNFSYKLDFVLSSTPSASSIKVSVNGSELSQSASNGWTYESSGNHIVFHGPALADNAQVTVTYEVN